MNLPHNGFGDYASPTVILCNPNSRPIKNEEGKVIKITHFLNVLSGITGLNITFNFNSTSDISFELYLRETADKQANTFAKEFYSRVVQGRYIYIEDVGYFQIVSVSEEEGAQNFKNVSAKSCDIELEDCSPPLINQAIGTDASISATISFSQLVSTYLAPCCLNWTFEIDDDETLKETYRTFDTSSDDYTGQSLYQFIFETIEDKYECVADVNYIDRIIKFYARNVYVESHKTDIYLTKRNLINNVSITSEADVYTAIKVTGGNDLDLSLIYPLGGNIVYDFSEKKSWMSIELQNKLTSWENEVSDAMDSSKNNNYANYISQWITQQEKVNKAYSDYQTAQEKTKNAQEAQVAAIKSNSDVTGAKSELTSCQQDEYAKKKIYDQENSSLSTITNKVNAISNKLKIENYFTSIDAQTGVKDATLLKELETYIKVAEYTDENIIQTDNMSWTEKKQQQQLLYERAVGQLAMIIVGEKKFNVDTTEILFNEKFKMFADQLRIGAIIHVEIGNNSDIQLHLITLSVNYDDKKSTLTFGNQYIKNDMKSLFDDVFGNVQKSQKMLNYSVGIIEQQAKEISRLQSLIGQVSKLTIDNIIQSDYQDFIVDKHGIFGREIIYSDTGKTIPLIDENTGEYVYDDKQIRLINKGLYLTKDGWNTLEAAIGEFVYYDPVDKTNKSDYGVVAKQLIGNIILSNNVGIYNKSGSIQMNEDGFIMTDFSSSLETEKNIFVIRKKTGISSGVDTFLNLLQLTNKGKFTVGNWNVGMPANARWGVGLYGYDENKKWLTILKPGGNVALSIGRPNTLSTETTEQLADSSYGAAVVITHDGECQLGRIMDSNGNFSYSSMTIPGRKGIEKGDSISVRNNMNFYGGNIALHGHALHFNGIDDENSSIQNNALVFTSGGNQYRLTQEYLGTAAGRIVLSSPVGDSSQNEYYVFYGTARGGHNHLIYYRNDNKQEKFYVEKTGDIKGNIVSGSDSRLKNSIENLPDNYSVLFDSLRPVRYKMNDGTSNRYHTGLIADEVNDAIKKANLSTLDFAAYVEENTDDKKMKALRYDEFISLLINEVQKLKKEVSSLQSERS